MVFAQEGADVQFADSAVGEQVVIERGFFTRSIRRKAYPRDGLWQFVRLNSARCAVTACLGTEADGTAVFCQGEMGTADSARNYTVIALNAGVFKSMRFLEEVTLPESLTEIAPDILSGCTHEVKIIAPEGSVAWIWAGYDE